MERIKQALEKAREERLMSGGTVGLAHPARVSRLDQGGSIVYSQTRVAQISPAELRENRIVTGFPNDYYSDAYKILRTQVLQRMQDNGWTSLAVTSAGENEGKSLTAINLAISLAKEVNYTVLLVDCDLRNPSIHKHMGWTPGRGLGDYLMEDIPVHELLVNPAGIERMVILLGGRTLPNSAEMLNSPKMSRLVNEFKSRYKSRIVIFDLPPILSSADALSFSPYVDAVLLVVEEGRTQAEDLVRAKDILQNIPIIGTVLNKSQFIKQKRYYGKDSIETTPRNGESSWLRRNKLVRATAGLVNKITHRFQRQP